MTELKNPMKEAVIILSGGMDSVTLLYDLLDRGYLVHALTFNYRQRHRRELLAAKATVELLQGKDKALVHKVLPLTALNQVGISALTENNIEVPEGHYAEESMKATVVPNRNMIFLSLAMSYALSRKIPEIYIGAHAGDHAIYPDCRPEFIDAMNKVAEVADYNTVKIVAPYLHMSKGDIVKTGLVLGVDYSKTWTCYKGGLKACGKCGSCTERREAFEENDQKDPIVYEVEQ